MEEKLGRKLLPDEYVHHNINGIRNDNNRPENLTTTPHYDMHKTEFDKKIS